MQRESKIRKYFELFTKDFKPDPDPQIVWEDYGNGVKGYSINSIELPNHLKVRMPYIVFIIFAKILQYKFVGRGEKIAWEIPVLYKDIPFILAHRKFGFCISSSEREDVNVNNIAVEAIEMINKATRYAEEIITPEIRKLVNGGRITLASEYREIHDRYMFFRRKCAAAFKNTDKESDISKLLREMKNQPFTTREGQFYLIAMLDAYYSLIEHILVLIIPFTRKKLPEDFMLEQFIGFNWKDKYNFAFAEASDNRAAVHLNQLIIIKDQYRNPIAHGHFEKNGYSLYVHMPSLGAIPMTLTKAKKSFIYGFNTLSVLTFKDVCDTFDAFDDFLNTFPATKYGIRYIKATFPVAFDPRSKREYANAMKSDKKFDEYLNKVGWELTNAMNMDW